MDYRHQRRPSSERFLTTTSISPPSTDAADELSEDDIFFFSGANVNHPPSSSTPPLSLHHNPKPFNKDAFGILAALPESSDESKHVFKHKPVISPPTPSSSSSSSSRMIPKPPMERQVINCYHSSAPMNVPLAEFRRREFDFNKCNSNNGGGDDDGDDEGEMLPPHEIVARKLAKSAKLSCSVLEGAGRTLKGRDLRQVRNAVFRQTGFID